MSFGINQVGDNRVAWVIGIGVAIYALIKIDDYLVDKTIENPPPAASPPPPTIPAPRLSLTDQQIQDFIQTGSINRNETPEIVAPVYTPPIDEPLARMVDLPSIMMLAGRRGAGKSAAAIRVQELSRHKAAPYAVGLPAKARKLLPDWYRLADDFSTIPDNSIIYVPESYGLFHSRNSQSAQGIAIGEIINKSRRRIHTIIFEVQNLAHIDRNILPEVDVLLIKEPGPFQQEFERPQFRSHMDSARTAFAGIPKRHRQKFSWVVAPGAGITGQLMENLLPTFWTGALSRIFGDSPIGKGAAPTKSDNWTERPTSTKGKRTSLDARSETAKKMNIAGHSYREIGKTLGCSPSTAFRLVNR